MGAGIAQVFATLGATVVLAESGDREAARERVINGLQRAAERDKLGGRTPAEVAARLTVVADIEDLPADADLVIEAVPEVVDLKLDVLHRVEGAVGPQCVIASNTSSLSIAVLAAALDAPHRLVGMHFFNPVPASTLVEIIRTPDTDGTVVDRVRGWVELLGKQEVLVNDSPGSPPAASVCASVSRRSACSRRAWPTPTRSTARWSSATATPWGRSGPPTSSASTSGSRSPSTWRRRWVSGSRRRSCCATWSPAGTSAARPAAASTPGPEPPTPVPRRTVWIPPPSPSMTASPSSR